MTPPNPFEHPDFVAATKVEDVHDGLKFFTFPDGFRCYSHSSELETMLIYNEIFIQQEYLGNAISLDNCRYIVDVGANIGLFTIFAKMRNPALMVHVFEPIRATYDVLVKNIELHGLTNVFPHNYALGREDDIERMMTFYPNAAGNATTDPESKVLHQQLLTEILGKEQADFFFHAAQVYTVQTFTLSAMIAKEGIPAIDLLKIDVEGDELLVLQGIADEHYPTVHQIVAEVHNDALLTEIQPFLTAKGFHIFSNTGIASGDGAGGNNLYAVRR